MRDEPSREVSSTSLEAIPRMEPRGGSAGNGVGTSDGSESHLGPNGEIGIDQGCESERVAGPDLATILKDIGETSRRWQGNVKIRNGIKNFLRSMATGAAVKRLGAQGQPKLPNPRAVDFAKVREVYPEVFNSLVLFEIKPYRDEDRKWVRSPVDRHAHEIKKLVKHTPIWPWVRSVKGLGELAVGHMLGMVGDPSKYAHYRMMVKSMGIAPRGAYPLSKKALERGQKKHKVPGQRRGIMLFNVIDPLLRNNDGKYREIYDAERARQIRLHPEMDRGIDKKTGKQRIAKYGDNVARMKVASVLISDLWHEWRAANFHMNAMEDVPPSEPHPNDGAEI